MGSRAHGTWAKLYADVWTHHKTAALARALEAIGVPRRWSLAVAVGQLHRLACGLAAQTDDGRLGHLAPQAFCALAGWDDHRKADAVLAAWMSSGFIDDPGTDRARLHGFDELFGELVRKRSARQAAKVRPSGGQRPAIGQPKIEIESKTLPSVEPPNPPAPDRTEALADLWAEVCPDLEQPRRPLAKGIRSKLVAALKREAGRDWRATFEDVAASDFLSGRKPNRDGSEPFRAALTWVIGPENLAKIDAGQYRTNGATARAPSRTATLAADAQAIYERIQHGTPPIEVEQSGP